MSGTNITQRKRKYKGRAPPGPDQAVIGWKEEEFLNLMRGMGFRSEWGAQYLPVGSTALDAPPGYITLYAAYFREGSFRLPITKFITAVLRGYGIHISQINAIGLPRITHFEYVCRAHRVEPTFEMFNVFYSVTYGSGFYSFQARTGVAPVCSFPLKGVHDWKQKIFYIRRGVIPMDMYYRAMSDGLPKVDVMEEFIVQDWYKKITTKETAISQLDEMALVGAGMSLLWVPKHPLGQPVYSYQGKFGYSLINVLDPKAAGAMVEAIQADGSPTWLDQIRGRFLHPTDESLGKYANEVLGEGAWYDSVDLGREEVIIVSSGSSDRTLEGLTSRCARAGTARGDVAEPVHGAGDDDEEEMPVDPSAQLETRKRARTSKSGKKEGKTEGTAAGSSRKPPSSFPYLDYVVVADTLSGLGVGERNQDSDPEERATLSEHMKKKALEDHKRRLDEQAAALLSAKKAKLHKEAHAAPSEFEIDMGVFSGGRGNLLEEIYVASAIPPVVKTSKKPRVVDISQITPPTSPPSRTVGLTPPRDDVETDKRERGVTEDLGEGGGDAGVVGGDGGVGKGKGVEVEVESSEATPRQTIYTKRPSGGDGATHGAVRSPQFEHNPADSWGTQNPACDDLPHAPRWNLTQGSRMNDVKNCHEFFAMSLPPAEKKEKEYVDRIDKLEVLVQQKATECETAQRLLVEKTAECQASELLAEEASADSKWLLSRGVPLLATYMFKLGRAGYNSSRKFGYAEGKSAAINNEKDYHFELYKEDCDGDYAAKRKVSHPNRWRNHRGAALGESDCSRESITTILR
ncbi:hypothetical protein Hanom_Chr14g01261291 [Helianthus anomalus]